MNYKDYSQLNHHLNSYVKAKVYEVPLSFNEIISDLKLEIDEGVKLEKTNPEKLLELLTMYVSKKKNKVSFESTFSMLDHIRLKYKKRHRRISISEMYCHRRCKLQHALRYDLRLRPKNSDWSFLNVGTWMHELIESLYKSDYEVDTMQLEIIINKYKEEIINPLIFEEGITAEKIESLIYDWTVASSLAIAYYHILFLTEKGQGLEMIPDNAEKWLRASMTLPSGRKSSRYEAHGKIDGEFLNHNDNNKYLHEIKSKSSYGQQTIEHLDLDDQVTEYLWMAQQNKLDYKGVYYSVMKKPKIKRKMLNMYKIMNVCTFEEIAVVGSKAELNKEISKLKGKFEIKELVNKYQLINSAGYLLKEAKSKKELQMSIQNDDGCKIVENANFKKYGLYDNEDNLLTKDDKKTPLNDKIKSLVEESNLIDEFQEIENHDDYLKRVQQAILGEDLNDLETMQKWVSREFVTRTEEQLKEFGRRLLLEAKDIAKNDISTCYATPAEPYNNYCAMCDYRPLCVNWSNTTTREELIKDNYVYPEQRFEEEKQKALEEEDMYNLV